jgi:gluconolactonase
MSTKHTVYRLTALFAILFFTQCGKDQNAEHINVADDELWTVISKDLTIDSIEGKYIFTEGPVWNEAGYFLFSDIPDNKIYKYIPEGAVEVFTDSSFNSNGLAYAPNGELLACEHGTRSISRYDKDKNREPIVSHYKGKRLNSPNDLTVHSSGAIYFTDPPWGLEGLDDDPAKELSFNGLFLFKDSTLLLQDSSMFRPNGVALSPDEKYLYVGETTKGHNPEKLWYRYELTDSLTLTNKTAFAKAPDSEIEGSPDGMKTDKDGNLFCTGPGGILIFNGKGKYLGLISLPKLPSNCAFGGENNELLMVTARDKVYILSNIKPGS